MAQFVRWHLTDRCHGESGLIPCIHTALEITCYRLDAYAPRYTSAKVSCTNCHAEGGIQPYASPVVGLPTIFPMYNKRAGRVISLQDRIQECFVRSENGRPLSYDGPEM